MKRTILMLLFGLMMMPGMSFTQSADWLSGQWEGIGYQKNNGHTWTIHFKAEGDQFRIDYPSLDCGGRWELISTDENKAVFKEVIEDGIFKCVTMGKVIVTYVDDQHLSFSWFEPYDDSLGAWSTLVRLPGS